MAKNALEKMNGSWESTAALMGNQLDKNIDTRGNLQLVCYYFGNVELLLYQRHGDH